MNPQQEALAACIEHLSEAAFEAFSTGEVSSPVLHLLREDSVGVLVLWPVPGLEAAQLARLAVGYFDPPMAAVLAEGWATNLALPREVQDALAGKRPWSEVSEQVRKRVAPALARNPALAEALRHGDVAALAGPLHTALVYAWHDATMGPVVRGQKSLKDLPADLRYKILLLCAEDREGRSETRLWRIEQRGGQRHFVPQDLAGAQQYASRWKPLYLAWEMAATSKLPLALVRPRVREMCGEQLRPYKLEESVVFTDAGIFFGQAGPPYKH